MATTAEYQRDYYRRRRAGIASPNFHARVLTGQAWIAQRKARKLRKRKAVDG